MKKFNELKTMKGEELYNYCCEVYDMIQKDEKAFREYLVEYSKKWFFQKKPSLPKFEIVEFSEDFIDRRIAWREEYILNGADWDLIPEKYYDFKRGFKQFVSTGLCRPGEYEYTNYLRICILEELMKISKDDMMNYKKTIKIVDND